MCKMETTTTAADVNERHILKQPTKVLLTLSNVLLPKEKLTSTPSMLDGLDSETEVDLRIVGCEWIQTAGILLKLPQVIVVYDWCCSSRFLSLLLLLLLVLELKKIRKFSLNPHSRSHKFAYTGARVPLRFFYKHGATPSLLNTSIRCYCKYFFALLRYYHFLYDFRDAMSLDRDSIVIVTFTSILLSRASACHYFMTERYFFFNMLIFDEWV